MIRKICSLPISQAKKVPAGMVFGIAFNIRMIGDATILILVEIQLRQWENMVLITYN